MAEASAGALLRAAREKQGLHIAALAAAIKVTPKKLEALEADRWDELSGAIFTRALAQSVCRVLRIDAKPVLALLPQPESPALAQVTGSLNAPFRDGGGRGDAPMATVHRVLIGAALFFAAAALVLALWPEGRWLVAPASDPAVLTPLPPSPSTPQGTGAAGGAGAAPIVAAGGSAVPLPSLSASAASAASPAGAVIALGAMASGPVPTSPTTVSLAPAVPPAAAAPTSPASPPAAVSAPPPPAATALRIEANSPTWIEVRERGGRVLLSRQLAAQETVGLDGSFPLTLTVGNAAGTKVLLRGAPVDLLAVARNNVARLEVQ